MKLIMANKIISVEVEDMAHFYGCLEVHQRSPRLQRRKFLFQPLLWPLTGKDLNSFPVYRLHDLSNLTCLVMV